MIPDFDKLSQFFHHSECEFALFELGRQIRALDAQLLGTLEAGEEAWPWPYLQHAWIGVVFWGEDQSHQIWTLRFPLDEQGKLHPDQLSTFINKLKRAIADNLQAAEKGTKLRAVMEGNPFVFELSEDRQASFHAKIKQQLGQAPSEFYLGAKDYFDQLGGKAKPQAEAWKAVGLQGIADLCAQQSQDEANRILQKAIPHLPEIPFLCACQCLEHESPSAELTQALSQRLGQSMQNPILVASALKAMSQSTAADIRTQDIYAILQSPVRSNPEILSTIATRCSEDLKNSLLTLPFLEALALLPVEAFKRIVIEILYQPGMRPTIMAACRNPDRSATLAVAIGALFGTDKSV